MSPRRQKGFTLVELAMALVVVALILGGLLVPLGTQVEQRKISETQKALDEIREALIGYALDGAHSATDGKPYLPCPDTDGDGLEQPRAAGVCPSQEGRVPWATLGTPKTDAWGNQFRYRVHPSFSSSTAGFTLSSSPNLRVCATAACTATLGVNLVAVVLSHGKNGYGARNDGGSVVAVPAGASADELENIDGRDNPAAGTANPDTADTADVDFVSRTASEAGTTAGEFDDLVTWLSSNILFAKVVAAARLP